MEKIWISNELAKKENLRVMKYVGNQVCRRGRRHLFSLKTCISECKLNWMIPNDRNFLQRPKIYEMPNFWMSWLKNGWPAKLFTCLFLVLLKLLEPNQKCTQTVAKRAKSQFLKQYRENCSLMVHSNLSFVLLNRLKVSEAWVPRYVLAAQYKWPLRDWGITDLLHQQPS